MLAQPRRLGADVGVFNACKLALQLPQISAAGLILRDRLLRGGRGPGLLFAQRSVLLAGTLGVLCAPGGIVGIKAGGLGVHKAQRKIAAPHHVEQVAFHFLGLAAAGTRNIGYRAHAALADDRIIQPEPLDSVHQGKAGLCGLPASRGQKRGYHNQHQLISKGKTVADAPDHLADTAQRRHAHQRGPSAYRCFGGPERPDSAHRPCLRRPAPVPRRDSCTARAAPVRRPFRRPCIHTVCRDALFHTACGAHFPGACAAR